MIGLGKKEEIFVAGALTEVDLGYQRPTRMPVLPEGHALVCGYDQGLGEHMIVCETIEDAQRLFDGYARGGASRIKWYSAEDPGFVAAVTPGP